ncbi:hypothetical protein ACS0TY_021693 [Phlomoides rotata]
MRRHRGRFQDTPSLNIANSVERSNDLSYANVTRGWGADKAILSHSQGEKTKYHGGYIYQTDEEDKAWLHSCFTGILKENFMWIDVGNKIQDSSEGKMLINFLEGKYGAEPWSERDYCNRWLVWTNWFGVPLHAWNPKFFRLMTTKFGSLVRIDEETLNKNNLHMARILIFTSYPEIPRNPFEMVIDDRIFSIRVREEGEVLEDGLDDWSSGNVCEDDGTRSVEDSESSEFDEDHDVEKVIGDGVQDGKEGNIDDESNILIPKI